MEDRSLEMGVRGREAGGGGQGTGDLKHAT